MAQIWHVQTKEREDIAKEETEPSLSPAVTKSGQSLIFPVNQILLARCSGHLWEEAWSSLNPQQIILCHKTLEDPSLDTDGVWGDPFHHDSP